MFIIDAVADLSDIFKPIPDESVAAWAAHAITLPQGQGANDAPNPDWSLTPDMPFVLDHVKHPDVREIVLAFAAQSCKTMGLLTMVAWMIRHTPMGILWVVPDIKLMRRIGDERLRKTYEISDVGLRGGKSDKRVNFLRFENCEMHIGIASSPRDLSSDPKGIVVIDEEDENPEFSSGTASPTKLANERMRTFRDRSKLLRACTPKLMDRGIWPAYQTTRMHKLTVRCPFAKCKKEINLEFKNIRWPKDASGHSADPEEIKTAHLAYYECPACGKSMPDHARDDLIQTCKWHCTTPGRPISRVGFHKSVLYSTFETWSSIAAEFLTSKSNIANLRNFNHSWLAEPKEIGIKYVKESQLRDELSGEYAWGEIPDAVQALTYGCDVGGDHLWVVILGWGYDGEIYKIISTRIDLIDVRISLNELWEFCELSWEGKKARMMGGGIDCGYNTGEVYNFCRRYPIWRPMKGADRRLTAPWIISIADPKHRYKDKARGLQLFTIHNDYFQDILQGYLQRGKGQGSGYFHVPAQCEDRYFSHLSNEVRRDGKWEPRYKSAPQHLRDSTKYAIAMGYILDLHRIRRPRITADLTDEQKKEIAEKSKMKYKKFSRLPTAWQSRR